MNREVNVIIEICALLAEQESLQTTAIQSAKGAGVIGGAAILGGLLGGKEGLLIGGLIGSVAGVLLTSDFKSIPQIIREDMTEAQRTELYRRIKTLFTGVMITDVTSTMELLAINQVLRSNVVSELGSYLRGTMDLSI